eukprot:gene24857-10517_t
MQARLTLQTRPLKQLQSTSLRKTAFNPIAPRRIARNATDGRGTEDIEPEITLSPSLIDSTTHVYEDDFWAYKPVWCQPSTIVATGTLGIVFSYALFENIFVTAVVSALVAAWWWLFLLVVPGQYKEGIRQHKKEEGHMTAQRGGGSPPAEPPEESVGIFTSGIKSPQESVGIFTSGIKTPQESVGIFTSGELNNLGNEITSGIKSPEESSPQESNHLRNQDQVREHNEDQVREHNEQVMALQKSRMREQ